MDIDMRKAMKETLELIRSRQQSRPMIGNYGCDLQHFESMYDRIESASPPFTDAKLGRWLGWIQGASAASGFLSLEEAKDINQRSS